jgi:hypothetical protein
VTAACTRFFSPSAPSARTTTWGCQDPGGHRWTWHDGVDIHFVIDQCGPRGGVSISGRPVKDHLRERQAREHRPGRAMRASPFDANQILLRRNRPRVHLSETQKRQRDWRRGRVSGSLQRRLHENEIGGMGVSARSTSTARATRGAVKERVFCVR